MKKNLTKILILTTLAAIITSSAKADPLPAPKTGFYIGAAVGGAALTGKGNLLFVVAGPVLGSFDLSSTDKNVAGDIFVGYGKGIHRLWLGVEAVGSLAPLGSSGNLSITEVNNPQSLEVKTTHAVGGALKLGYPINSTSQLYIKAGFELRRFKVNFRDPSNTFVKLNKNYNSTAFVPGFGMEVDLTPSFSLRTEYRMALHPNKTVQAANSATQRTSVQTKPTIHYFNLGLIFKI